jgi:predicted Kef-type K+ transport protein
VLGLVSAFGSVDGYLLAGIVIGPAGLRLVTDANAIANVAALGLRGSGSVGGMHPGGPG